MFKSLIGFTICIFTVLALPPNPRFDSSKRSISALHRNDASILTNGERFKRGLPPLPPKKRYDPTRISRQWPVSVFILRVHTPLLVTWTDVGTDPLARRSPTPAVPQSAYMAVYKSGAFQGYLTFSTSDQYMALTTVSHLIHDSTEVWSEPTDEGLWLRVQPRLRSLPYHKLDLHLM